MLTNPERNRKVKDLKAVADDLDCSLAQLAIAWCARNKNVSTVITGASRPDQVRENMKSLDVIDRIDEKVIERIDTIIYFS
jgi:aryl-alcohol dehydrogenase-like predicted oxidoreductase